MTSNSKSKKEKEIIKDGASDSTTAQHAANGKIITTPDYSSMKREIEKIRDPVPFEEIKDFYDVE